MKIKSGMISAVEESKPEKDDSSKMGIVSFKMQYIYRAL